MTGQLILALSILVGIHELGHFLAARMFGIRVDKFYIFFDAWGKKIWSKKIGNTEYGIGWLPLGGYVKIAGMIDESMDKEQMAKPAEPDEFRSKPGWQRFIVMVAGVVMNVILSIVIFWMLLGFISPNYVTNEEGNKLGLYASSVAQEMGFETGDKVIRVDGKDRKRLKDNLGLRLLFAEEVTVERDGKLVEIKLPSDVYGKVKGVGVKSFLSVKEDVIVADFPEEGHTAAKSGLKEDDQVIAVNGDEIFAYREFKELIADKKNSKAVITVIRDGEFMHFPVDVDSAGTIGVITTSGISDDYKETRYSFAEVIGFGFRDAFSTLWLQAKGFGKMISGEEKVRDSLGGPIMIAKVYGGKWNWVNFFGLTAMLSMILAFMNILPIPALDGGHIFFIIIEGIIGRKLPDSFMEKAQVAGMIILLLLMVFIFGNDIINLVK